MDFPRDWYEAFTHKDCDRRQWIQDTLAQNGIDSGIVATGDSRHVMVRFRPQAYDASLRFRTVLAHYDRFPGSPGANDNSSSVLGVIAWALRLRNYRGAHNVRIFFTDGEEMGGEACAGVSSQGAYGLATLYRQLGITGDDVYVFDCCGRGDVPVLATCKLSQPNPRNPFTMRLASLTERTRQLLQRASPRKWLALPVPYSDNAGFLACGIPAVAITFLPAEEAGDYMRNLMKDKNLEAAVMNRARQASLMQKEQAMPDFMYKEQMPLTWRLLHTEYDNMLSLTPVSFALMARILDVLAQQRTA